MRGGRFFLQPRSARLRVFHGPGDIDMRGRGAHFGETMLRAAAYFYAYFGFVYAKPEGGRLCA